jgi:hypothetical protein
MGPMGSTQRALDARLEEAMAGGACAPSGRPSLQMPGS